MPETLNLTQKQELTKKVKSFTLKEGIMYKMGQYNKMHICSTTSETHIVFKELHGVVKGHFATNIIAKKIWM